MNTYLLAPYPRTTCQGQCVFGTKGPKNGRFPSIDQMDASLDDLETSLIQPRIDALVPKLFLLASKPLNIVLLS
jgi:hypothetical protein